MIRRVCGEITLAAYEKNLAANHAQYAEQLQADAAAGKDIELVSWLHDNTRNCPRCSVIIYRFAGCDSMSCKCGMSFNWQQAPKLDLPQAVKRERERAAVAAAMVQAKDLLTAGSCSSAMASLRKAIAKWPDSTELQALLAETERVVAESERQAAAAAKQRFDERFSFAAHILDDMLRLRAQQLVTVKLEGMADQQIAEAEAVATDIPDVEAAVAGAEAAAAEVAEAEAAVREAEAMVARAEAELQAFRNPDAGLVAWPSSPSCLIPCN